MDQGVIKCVKLNYCKLLTLFLLADMEDTSSDTQHAKTISVVYAITWIADAAKQMSPQMVQKCFQKA
jgi:hypothetical protein